MNTTRKCGYCASGYVNGYSLNMYDIQNLEHSWSWSGDLPFSSLSNLGGAIETCEYQIGSQLNCGRASRRNRRNRFSEVVHSKERDLGRAGFMESPCVERGRDCPRQYRLVRGGFNTQCVLIFSRFSPQQHESSNSYRSVICGGNGIKGRKNTDIWALQLKFQLSEEERIRSEMTKKNSWLRDLVQSNIGRQQATKVGEAKREWECTGRKVCAAHEWSTPTLTNRHPVVAMATRRRVLRSSWGVPGSLPSDGVSNSIASFLRHLACFSPSYGFAFR